MEKQKYIPLTDTTEGFKGMMINEFVDIEELETVER
jgi:hypothetical protein